MTSAVPYDPEEFDNNPFAESSIILPPSEEASRPFSATPHEDPDQNTDENQEESHVEPQGQEASVSNNNDGAVATQQQDNNDPAPPVPSMLSENESIFHKYPTAKDIEIFLPERHHAKSFSLKLKIVEIEKNGNSFKNPVVKFNAQAKDLPGYRNTIYRDVRRTYRELDSLYKYLIYNNIEVFVPALPKMPTLYNPGSTDFLNSFTKSLQQWFNRITRNPLLARNQEFVLFLEQNDFGYTPSKTRPSNNSVMATGLKRHTLKQFQPPYDASQDLAEYRPMIKSMHILSVNFLKQLDKFLKLQKSSSAVNSDFFTKLSDLSHVEPPNSDMSKMWLKMNKVLQLFNELDFIKEINFGATLIDSFNLIQEDTFNIKEALTNRHLLMRELLNANDGTKKRTSTINKLKTKSVIDPIKVEEAIRALESAKAYEKELVYQVKRTTYNMLIESKEYIEILSRHIRVLLKMLAQHQIQYERKKLVLLSQNKPILAHESLSRLGREDKVPLTRSPTKPITAGGDSWNDRPKKRFEVEGSNLIPDDLDILKKDEPVLKPDDSFTPTTEEFMKVDTKSAASLLGTSTF